MSIFFIDLKILFRLIYFFVLFDLIAVFSLVPFQDNLLNKANSFGQRLNSEEAERNESKAMLKFHHIKSEKFSNCVKITEITNEKVFKSKWHLF